MSTLPSIDLGLMAEHLAAHEGVINKLQYYYHISSTPRLKSILSLQTEVMLNHVQVMMAFINPHNNESINVSPIPDYSDISLNMEVQEAPYHDKWITLEAHNTAKCMANENFTSSLMMKNQNVKKAHEDMALQQAHIQDLYNEIISNMNWSYVPRSSLNAQTQTYQFYQQVYS